MYQQINFQLVTLKNRKHKPAFYLTKLLFRRCFLHFIEENTLLIGFIFVYLYPKNN